MTMRQPPKPVIRKVRDFSVAGVAVFALAAIAAIPAGAATNGVATAQPVGVGPGYADVLPSPILGSTAVFAATMSVEGASAVNAYCLDSNLAYNGSTSATYTAGTQTSSNITNVSKAADVAANSATIGTPLTNPDAEAVAVQLAIWNLTDGYVFTAVPNADIVARATALVNGATALPQGIIGGNLKATTAQSGTSDTVTANLTDVGGAAIVNQTIFFTGPSGPQQATTDSQGNATVTFAARAGTETATWNGTLPAGTVLFPPGDTQRMVTTSPSPIVRTTTVNTAAVTTPTTTPPTTTPPATTPPATTPPATTPPATTPPATTPTASTPPKQLPYTGTWVHPYYLILALLTAVAAVVIRHKLRVKH